MPRQNKRFNRRQNRRQHNQDGSPRRTGSYVNVVVFGETLAQTYEDNWDGLTHRQQVIFAYYARPEIQDAMFRYAQGRKITVLRTFRPLYNRIEAPEDILPLALYHTEEKGLWPSFHGMISRYENQHVCDFVVEIDYKRSWSACFKATLPYIQALRDFGVYARIKFSGHVSAHVIIPGETFPPDIGDVRRPLMDYAQKIVGYPERLDRYFLQSSHFLRLPYSLNERTGLVSLPIMMDEFEQFSWQKARVENVQTVLEDWFEPPPEDAPERVRALVKFAEQQYHIFRQQELEAQTQKRQAGATRKRSAGAIAPLITEDAYQKMLTTAQEEWDWCEALLESEALRTSLSELRDYGDVITLEAVASEYGLPLTDLWRVWRWVNHLPALEYYADQEVQEQISAACAMRRVRFWSEEAQFSLGAPEDVYPLAIYYHRQLGQAERPSFLMSVARYTTDFQELDGYDMVLEVDGGGLEQSAAKIGAEIGHASSDQGLSYTVYHAGMPCLYFWVDVPETEDSTLDELTQQYGTIADDIRTKLRQAGLAQATWRLLKHDEFVPVPYSLNFYTGKPCVAVDLTQ